LFTGSGDLKKIAKQDIEKELRFFFYLK